MPSTELEVGKEGGPMFHFWRFDNKFLGTSSGVSVVLAD